MTARKAKKIVLSDDDDENESEQVTMPASAKNPSTNDFQAPGGESEILNEGSVSNRGVGSSRTLRDLNEDSTVQASKSQHLTYDPANTSTNQENEGATSCRSSSRTNTKKNHNRDEALAEIHRIQSKGLAGMSFDSSDSEYDSEDEDPDDHHVKSRVSQYHSDRNTSSQNKLKTKNQLLNSLFTLPQDRKEHVDHEDDRLLDDFIVDDDVEVDYYEPTAKTEKSAKKAAKSAKSTEADHGEHVVSSDVEKRKVDKYKTPIEDHHTTATRNSNAKKRAHDTDAYEHDAVDDEEEEEEEEEVPLQSKKKRKVRRALFVSSSSDELEGEADEQDDSNVDSEEDNSSNDNDSEEESEEDEEGARDGPLLYLQVNAMLNQQQSSSNSHHNHNTNHLSLQQAFFHYIELLSTALINPLCRKQILGLDHRGFLSRPQKHSTDTLLLGKKLPKGLVATLDQASKQIENIICTHRESLLGSSAWQPEFYESLKTRPFLLSTVSSGLLQHQHTNLNCGYLGSASNLDSRKSGLSHSGYDSGNLGQKCEACNRSAKHEKSDFFSMCFTGPVYESGDCWTRTKWIEAIPQDLWLHPQDDNNDAADDASPSDEASNSGSNKQFAAFQRNKSLFGKRSTASIADIDTTSSHNKKQKMIDLSDEDIDDDDADTSAADTTADGQVKWFHQTHLAKLINGTHEEEDGFQVAAHCKQRSTLYHTLLHYKLRLVVKVSYCHDYITSAATIAAVAVAFAACYREYYVCLYMCV